MAMTSPTSLRSFELRETVAGYCRLPRLRRRFEEEGEWGMKAV
jgi:hypothetical protein